METKIMDINSLRVILAEEINSLRKGQSTAANVNAIVNATGKILSTVKLEMEYSKIIGKTPDIDFIKIKTAQKKLAEKAAK